MRFTPGIQRRVRRAVCALALAALALPVLPGLVTEASAAPATSAPFTECPAAGHSTSCGILIIINPDGTATVIFDPNSGNPYEQSDDTTVGVFNNSASTVPVLTLSSSLDIFGFDGDGMCAVSSRTAPNPAGCPFDTNTAHPGHDYAGPGITYTNINAAKTIGDVNFASSCSGGTTCAPTPGGLTAGSTIYFSLENKLTGVNVPKASPTISTTPSSGVAGGNVSDSATLAGGRVPTGTITFALYKGTGCTAPAFATTTATVNGNGTYGSGDVPVSASGHYEWIATYGGDGNNNGKASTCGQEPVDVGKAKPTISTTPSSGVAGGSVSDSATLAGGAAPTGSIVFNLYKGTGCTAPAFATKTATVNGNGTYGSGDVPVSAAGHYEWIATYGGDGNNNGKASTCSQEPVDVGKAKPTISTTPSSGVAGGNVSDGATLAGGQAPTGTITFTLYKGTVCTPATLVATKTAAVNGNGTYGSGNVPVTTAGTYNWIATYSGDDNNEGVASTCGAETVQVDTATPAITTTPSGSAPAGSNISDSATLSLGAAPTGTITFALYNNSTCTAPAFATRTAAVNGNGTYTSGNVPVNTAGTYNWVATYGGDANNKSVASKCGDETVRVIAPTMTGRAFGLSLGGLLVIKPTPDTGQVSTSQASTTAPPCILTLPVPPLVLAHTLCASVVTSLNPSTSTANASVQDATVAIPGAPVIKAGVVQSNSTTSCAGSSGSTTIAFLKIGDTVVIPSPTPIPPNTKIVNLGPVQVILNEQIQIPGGLTVNAVHIVVSPLVDLILSSSTSDIHGCPTS